MTTKYFLHYQSAKKMVKSIKTEKKSWTLTIPVKYAIAKEVKSSVLSLTATGEVIVNPDTLKIDAVHSMTIVPLHQVSFVATFF